jgi:hypothetical protein
LLGAAGVNYVPKWTEMAASLAIFTAAVVVFRWAVLNLSIFPRELRQPPSAPAWRSQVPLELPGQPAVMQSFRIH